MQAVLKSAEDFDTAIDLVLLMPATRHNMVHINESLRLKEKLMRRKK